MNNKKIIPLFIFLLSATLVNAQIISYNDLKGQWRFDPGKQGIQIEFLSDSICNWRIETPEISFKKDTYSLGQLYNETVLTITLMTGTYFMSSTSYLIRKIDSSNFKLQKLNNDDKRKMIFHEWSSESSENTYILQRSTYSTFHK